MFSHNQNIPSPPPLCRLETAIRCQSRWMRETVKMNERMLCRWHREMSNAQQQNHNNNSENKLFATESYYVFLYNRGRWCRPIRRRISFFSFTSQLGLSVATVKCSYTIVQLAHPHPNLPLQLRMSFVRISRSHWMNESCPHHCVCVSTFTDNLSANSHLYTLKNNL